MPSYELCGLLLLQLFKGSCLQGDDEIIISRCGCFARFLPKINPLTLSPMDSCSHKAYINLYGFFRLGVNIKYKLSCTSLPPCGGYTGERVKLSSSLGIKKIILYNQRCIITL